MKKNKNETEKQEDTLTTEPKTELQSTEKPEQENKVQETSDNVDDAFEKFNTVTSEFDPEGQEQKPQDEGQQKQNVLDHSSRMKLKMFLNFACFLLQGMNHFMLNMLSPVKTDFKDLQLMSDEKESIEPYLDSPQILEFINKLPVWIIGIAHVEYIFIRKHSEAVDEKKRLLAEEKKNEEKK